MIEKHTIRDRAQWLGLRRNDLTASDLGAYLGFTPWKSPAELFAEKMGLGADDQLDDNRVLRRGRRDEYAILRICAEENPGWSIAEAKVYLRDPEIRLGATPDAFYSEDGELGILQCKSVAMSIWRDKWQADEGGPITPPKMYLIQTLCEAMLADVPKAMLAVWVRTQFTEEMHYVPVRRDPVVEAQIRDLAVRFWKEVEAGTPPAFDHARDVDVVSLFHPKEQGDEIDLSGDNEACSMLAEYCALRDEISGLEARKKELATGLKAKLGDAPAAKVGDGKVSWKTVHRKERIVKASESRSLRVTAPKKEKAT